LKGQPAVVVARAQVILPNNQPDVMNLPSQCKANLKALTTLSVNNSSSVALLVDWFFRLLCVQIYKQPPMH